MLEETIQLLNHADPAVRFEAAQKLGASNDRRAVAPLIDALPDDNAKVQYAALSGLIKLGDPSAAHALVDLLLSDPDSRVWDLLKLGIGQRLRSGLLDMITPGDIPLADRLAAALEEEILDEQQQAFIVRLLGRTRDTRAVDMLINRLAEDTLTMQAAAAEALGYIGDLRAVTPLLPCLSSPSDAVREVAIEALGRLGDPRAVDPVIAALSDEHEWVRRAACVALGQLGEKRAVEPLAEALGDEFSIVQDAAFEAIKHLSDTSFHMTH
ncbi:MAG: HEAT repeat domain-containing protein [Chloroflexota bacterium]